MRGDSLRFLPVFARLFTSRRRYGIVPTSITWSGAGKSDIGKIENFCLAPRDGFGLFCAP